MHPWDLLNASTCGLRVGGWEIGRGQRPENFSSNLTKAEKHLLLLFFQERKCPFCSIHADTDGRCLQASYWRPGS